MCGWRDKWKLGNVYFFELAIHDVNSIRQYQFVDGVCSFDKMKILFSD